MYVHKYILHNHSGLVGSVDKPYVYMYIFSKISDSGRSEIRAISLQRTQLEVPRYFLTVCTYVVPIHFGPPK